jgi:hypothetical protein
MTAPALTVEQAPCGCPLEFPLGTDNGTDSFTRYYATCGGHGREWQLTVTLMPRPTGRYLADNVEVAS